MVSPFRQRSVLCLFSLWYVSLEDLLDDDVVHDLQTAKKKKHRYIYSNIIALIVPRASPFPFHQRNGPVTGRLGPPSNLDRESGIVLAVAISFFLSLAQGIGTVQLGHGIRTLRIRGNQKASRRRSA